jgi:hypothetical protein
VIGEAAPGDNYRAKSGRLHCRGGFLGYDYGADDVDGVGLLQMGHGRTQELIRRADDRVVDYDSWRALVAVKLRHSGAQVLRVARVRLDRVDLGASVSQAPRELIQSVCAARDQSHRLTVGQPRTERSKTLCAPTWG